MAPRKTKPTNTQTFKSAEAVLRHLREVMGWSDDHIITMIAHWRIIHEFSKRYGIKMPVHCGPKTLILVKDMITPINP